ncbi:MAG: sodium:calcium antiporter [Candidatus Aenigmarchaeota archaeon]|nr:sodium:calcium antiporter [Candidatus Aenigmarchaeota archaeon]
MAIVESVLIFIAALFILAKASSFAVRHTVRFSKLSGINQLAVGFLLLAISTSLPEITITILSTLRGEGLLGLSTAVGSSIGDMTLILGIAAFSGFVTPKRDRSEVEFALITGAAVAFIILILRTAGPVFGIFGLVVFFAYMHFIVKEGIPIKNNISKKGLKTPVMIKSAIYAIASVIVVAISANFLVNSAVEISLAAGVSEALLGATVIAFGSFMPELTLTVVAMRHRNVELALGNAAGSVITNVALVGGIAALGAFTLDLVASVAVSFLIVGCMIGYKMIDRGRFGIMEGIFLCSLYFAYLIIMILISQI